MEEKICSVCRAGIDSEDAAILTLGGFGMPRYLCSVCEADFDAAATEREISEIDGAIDRISKKMTAARIDDTPVLKTVEELMIAARERREKIRAGEYDFSEDEISDAEEEEIPEELLETEEDIANERREAEKNKKLDRITNIICAVLGLTALGFFIYKMITTYFI